MVLTHYTPTNVEQVVCTLLHTILTACTYIRMYRVYLRAYVYMYIVCMQNHQGLGPEGGT